MGRLFQETLYRRPFWMLVACILVNRTTWKQAKSAHAHLMGLGIKYLSRASYGDVELAIEHLGLYSSRARSIVDLAKVWLSMGLGRDREAVAGLMRVRALPGCGQYAADSWAIFIELKRPRAKDKKLKAYLARTRPPRRTPHVDQALKHGSSTRDLIEAMFNDGFGVG